MVEETKKVKPKYDSLTPVMPPAIDPFIANIDPALVKSDPRRRISKTPFGPVGPGETPILRTYLGAAVPWKRNPAARPDKVRERNEAFTKEIKAFKGSTGVAIIEKKTGEKVLVSMPAAKLAEKHGTAKIIATAKTYKEFVKVPKIPGMVIPVTALI